MKRLFTLLLLATLLNKVYAQKADSLPSSSSTMTQEDNDPISSFAEELPRFPGGEEARMKFMVENIRYPAEALKAGIEGMVYLSFVVRKDGSVTDVKVMKGLGYGCDEEAMRVVKSFPKFVPALLHGKNVSFRLNLPIRFRLTQPNDGIKH